MFEEVVDHAIEWLEKVKFLQAEKGGIMYIYIKTEPMLWTVGFYGPDGRWEPDRDYNTQEEAAKRAAWLNGNARAYDDLNEPEKEKKDQGKAIRRSTLREESTLVRGAS